MREKLTKIQIRAAVPEDVEPCGRITFEAFKQIAEQVTGTLIADQDGIYSPAEFNDRLVLGLKGTMSEAELHLIRARLDGGLRNKAERGELRLALPVGLDRDEDDRIVLCPDEQVRHAVERVFVLWRRLGSARQVVMELTADDQQLPRRTVGQRRIRWACPSTGAVHDFLTKPAYAGAFVFGRRRREKRLDRDGRVRVRDVEVPLEEWSVCLPEHHPGYVSWDEYLATRARLRANVRPRGEGGGAAREGAALLQGLLRCGRCGRRMQVGYAIAVLGRRHDLYVGVALRVQAEGTRDAIAAGWALWADCEGSAAAAALGAFAPSPAIVVWSGSGENRHGYWPLTAPLGPDELEQANPMEPHGRRVSTPPGRRTRAVRSRSNPRAPQTRSARRLARALGADEASVDAARVLRAPGSLNFKHDPPATVALERFTGE